MDPDQDSRLVGRHRLGPHVVGKRVVVRRLVRGERGVTGGPAFTDVLGVCTAWGPDECVVEREDGSTVRIRIGDIVSGKPVPPRPSVRSRISARDAEEHALVLWPGIERERLGDWVLRSDPAPQGRPVKRANSCLAMGTPGVSLKKAERRVRSFYADRGRTPIVQLEVGSENDRWFAGRAWEAVSGGDSHFQIAPLPQALRAARSGRPAEVPDLLADQPGEVRVDVVEHGPRVNLEVRTGGHLVAGVRAGVDGDWVGVHALDMVPGLRRRGLGRRLMIEVLEWSAEQGATTVWLHVETDNQPALAFYAGMGFRTHHSLRYRQPSVDTVNGHLRCACRGGPGR